MIFEWESERQRLLRHMKMPPVKKLEWLRQMSEFTAAHASERNKAIKRELKEKGY